LPYSSYRARACRDKGFGGIFEFGRIRAEAFEESMGWVLIGGRGESANWALMEWNQEGEAGALDEGADGLQMALGVTNESMCLVRKHYI